jgi:hypothetical protein
MSPGLTDVTNGWLRGRILKSGKQLCPSCEWQLTVRYRDAPLPVQLRLLLKCTLPEPRDPLKSVPEGLVQAVQAVESNEHLGAVDHRLAELESKFSGVDAKLDQLFTLLSLSTGLSRLRT